MKNDKTSAPLRTTSAGRRLRAGESSPSWAPRAGGRRAAGRKTGRRGARADRAARQPGRESLLAAATSLFAELGYDAVTTRQILERAGVEAPSLYHHFGSKLGLYRAVLSDTSEPFVERFVRIGAKLRRSDGAGAQSVLEEMVWALFRGALTNPETVRIALFEATRPGPRRYDVILVWEQLRNVFKAVLEDAEAAGELAMPAGGAGLVANNFIGSMTVHLQLATVRWNAVPAPSVVVGKADAYVNRRMLTRRLARQITAAIVEGLKPRSRAG